MQRYFAQDKYKDSFLLSPNDIYHIKKVMRMKCGDEIEVVHNRLTYLCQIINLTDFELQIIHQLDEDNELTQELIVAIGLVKEQKMDLILQKLTELGITKIIPLKMERSIVKLDEKKSEKKLERWQTICKEASEQSKRNIVPEVLSPMSLKELIKINADYKLVCSTKENKKLVNYYLQGISSCDKMIFVIGPEGGISESEEEYLVANGYTSVSLGKRILRVETAAIYVASILNFSSMR